MIVVESNLVVREGRISNGRLLQWRNGSDFVELAVAIEVGYYVRLTGTFNSSSRLEIAYAAFSQKSKYYFYLFLAIYIYNILNLYFHKFLHYFWDIFWDGNKNHIFRVLNLHHTHGNSKFRGLS